MDKENQCCCSSQSPIKTIIVSIFAIFAIGYLFAKFFGPFPFSISQVTTTKTTAFDVSAEGKVTAVPDTAEIALGVQISKSTIKEAQTQANDIIKKITDGLKDLGIKNEQIKTSRYEIYPNYDYRAGRGINGYNVNVSLTVKVKDFDKINEAIDVATKLGANQIGQLQLKIDDEKLEELKAEARKKAVKEAKKKANELAGTAGLKLGKLINVQESYVSPVPYPRIATDIGGMSEKQTSIQPGETEVSVSVTLSYETL